ncbi:hypothetical protein TWF191_001974 [Orbilia oligospora]|uniref:Methyltransferase domain-containing protein n=1 Tax=Orbilia oligospora TaxID=2813651 RepID=A0A7C8QD55_ORBOL|nr:hypothetical protein TWF191_001974 [Orbilia oligospora]
MDFSGFIYTCPSSQYLDKSTCIAKMMEPGLSPAFQYQRPAAHRERLVPVPLTTLPDGILPLSPTLTSTSTVTATGAIPLAAKKEPQKYFMGRPVHPNYHYKKNRRYAGDESIPYPLPCDQQEVNRQNLIHHIFNEVFGTIHAAEFPRFEDIPSKVLDVGCGSGLWIASMSDEFAARGKPNVQFTGLDIVRNCPDMAGVNFRFVKHNILNLPLPFATGEFDYIMSPKGRWDPRSTMFRPHDTLSIALQHPAFVQERGIPHDGIHKIQPQIREFIHPRLQQMDQSLSRHQASTHHAMHEPTVYHGDGEVIKTYKEPTIRTAARQSTLGRETVIISHGNSRKQIPHIFNINDGTPTVNRKQQIRPSGCNRHE